MDKRAQAGAQNSCYNAVSSKERSSGNERHYGKLRLLVRSAAKGPGPSISVEDRIMNSLAGMAFLRKVGFFSLLGLAAVMAAGPLLAIVSAVLSLTLALLSLVVPLALAGVLVWLAFRAVCPANPDTLEALAQKGRDAGRAACA